MDTPKGNLLTDLGADAAGRSGDHGYLCWHGEFLSFGLSGQNLRSAKPVK